MRVEKKVHFGRGRKSEKVLKTGEPAPKGRLQRVTKLMALAIKFDELIRTGKVKSFTELAELGHVSRTRITQIMNLTLLSPAMQEWLLFLPRIERGEDSVLLRDL